MAGSIVVTTLDLGSKITRYTVTWTSDASGDVTGNTFVMMMGTLVAVGFSPGAGGSQPSDLYDVDCLTAANVTVFDNGAGTSIGSNLSNVLSSHHVPLTGLTGVTIYRRWTPGGAFQLTVANAGDTKSGTVSIFVAEGIL